eukprot:scaffold42355_cov62-Phaeocystis_antarctica.AAC.6
MQEARAQRPQLLSDILPLSAADWLSEVNPLAGHYLSAACGGGFRLGAATLDEGAASHTMLRTRRGVAGALPWPPSGSCSYFTLRWCIVDACVDAWSGADRDEFLRGSTHNPPHK